ncbi:MAG: hypothetical protein U0269_12525 [Polyangiales bacterium]
MDSVIDSLLVELARRTLEPARSQLDPARAAVRGLRSAREACEALAAQGLVSPTFLSDDARRFAFTTATKELREDEITSLGVAMPKGLARTAPFPTSVALALAVAADFDAFVSAEALAVEAAARLWPWVRAQSKGPCPTRVVWKSHTRSALLGRKAPDLVEGCLVAHDAALFAIGESSASERGVWRPTVGVSTVLMERAAPYALGARAWKLAAAARATVPRTLSSGYAGALEYPTPEAVAGRAFDALADPFEPVLELWSRGYRLISIGRDAVLLGIAPV